MSAAFWLLENIPLLISVILERDAMQIFAMHHHLSLSLGTVVLTSATFVHSSNCQLTFLCVFVAFVSVHVKYGKMSIQLIGTLQTM